MLGGLGPRIAPGRPDSLGRTGLLCWQAQTHFGRTQNSHFRLENTSRQKGLSEYSSGLLVDYGFGRPTSIKVECLWQHRPDGTGKGSRALLSIIRQG